MFKNPSSVCFFMAKSYACPNNDSGTDCLHNGRCRFPSQCELRLDCVERHLAIARLPPYLREEYHTRAGESLPSSQPKLRTAKPPVTSYSQIIRGIIDRGIAKNMPVPD